jgi:hypothetical protein
MRLLERIRNFGLKRAAIAGLAGGLVTMALDAGVAHFAGRPMKHPAQLIPIIFGAVVVALFGALSKWDGERLSKVARIVGASAAAVGAIGSAYHALALLRMVTANGGFDANLLGVAISIAPPLLAPGAFVGLGAALWMLASPRVGITLAAERHEPRLAAA